jgi:hypothetical protein
MNKTKLPRRSLELTPKQWQALDELARIFGALSAAGPKAKSPSWRVLIQKIANKQIVLSVKENPND